MRQLGSITIFVEDRHNNANELNLLLSDRGRDVMSRLGINVNRQCRKGCPGMIILAVEGTKEDLKDLLKQINKLQGIKAKLAVVAEE